MIDLVLPDGFVITEPLWFITQSTHPTDPVAWILKVLSSDTQYGRVVPCFTDVFNAERYVERHNLKGKVLWFSINSHESLSRCLSGLIVQTYTQLTIDPEEHHAKYVPIDTVFRVVERKLRK